MPNTETINWGWLNDATGNKFAPITFYEKIYTENGRTFKDELKNPTINGDGNSNGIIVEGAQRLRGPGGAPRAIGGLGRPIYFSNGEPTSIGDNLKVPDTLIMMGSTSEGAVTPTIHFGPVQESGDAYQPPEGRSVDLNCADIKWENKKLIFSSGNGQEENSIKLNFENNNYIYVESEDNSLIFNNGVVQFGDYNTNKGGRVVILTNPETAGFAIQRLDTTPLFTVRSTGSVFANGSITANSFSTTGNISGQQITLSNLLNEEENPSGKKFIFADNSGKIIQSSLPILPDIIKFGMEESITLSPEAAAQSGDDGSGSGYYDPELGDPTPENVDEKRISELQFRTADKCYGKIKCRNIYKNDDHYTQIAFIARNGEEAGDTFLSLKYNYPAQDGSPKKHIVSVGSNTVIKGAAWNDYAEYRNQIDDIEPGYCVCSSDNGKVFKTTEKFTPCDGIVSDTYGFAIGDTDECRTPIAVAGRVLVYCGEDRNTFHAGDTVCAGPEGKVYKMTREEIREYPDRIVGVVSEIPQYEIWNNGIEVKGRIWVNVK